MLRRRTADNGVVFYESPLLAALGVPHGFSTRIGGVSGGPFESLNLGNPNGCPVQDDVGRIAENYARFQSALGVTDRARAQVHQVHTDMIAVARPGEQFDLHQQADAILTNDPTRVLSIRTADCLPVLLATADGRTVAAAHAGWRGVAAGIVPKLFAGLTDDRKWFAAVGPAIGFDAFEVGVEVVEIFERLFPGHPPVRRTPDGKGRVDLQAAVVSQLIAAGIAPGNIDTTDRCTFTHADEFFSHRREAGVTGRLAALIGAIA